MFALYYYAYALAAANAQAVASVYSAAASGPAPQGPDPHNSPITRYVNDTSHGIAWRRNPWR